MKAATLETWTWVLIYGGLIMLCLAVFVARQDDVLGIALGIAGACACALGVVLIWARSRLEEEPR